MHIDKVEQDEKPGWKLFFDGAANMKGSIGLGRFGSVGAPDSGRMGDSGFKAHTPFVAWGMDVIGPIEQAASKGHRFILVAINYFTKWVEAITFKSVTKTEVSFDERGFKITYRNSTPYRPKANGAVEADNKNIKKILRKIVQGSSQWHEKLPFALLGYRTTIRTSVGATPYLLVYGTEAVIPAEVEIPSIQIVVEAEIDDDEWVKTRLEQLSQI
ncbi:uncharacterized protein [Nicotiana sylvestris]|uniref:uncharacterized protein n=1 Tax=Nicotiana sylvestris TaxID=4096 RepID=UPI00388C55D5